MPWVRCTLDTVVRFCTLHWPLFRSADLFERRCVIVSRRPQAHTSTDFVLFSYSASESEYLCVRPCRRRKGCAAASWSPLPLRVRSSIEGDPQNNADGSGGHAGPKRQLFHDVLQDRERAGRFWEDQCSDLSMSKDSCRIVISARFETARKETKFSDVFRVPPSCAPRPCHANS